MDTAVRVKKSLRTPIRKLSSCVSAPKDGKSGSKRRSSRSRRGGAGPDGTRTRTRRGPQTRDQLLVRSYQADLDKERKLREATNAQKNAERAAMRAHFRRKYQLSENWKDTTQLRSVGGKVSLPGDLSRIVHPDGSKDDGFDLLAAFRGLGFGTPTPAAGQSCKVM